MEYYYITNLQGDVVSLVNPTTGAPVATYEYDPFGKVISATGTMADINPPRYRGYVYDSETGLYYLQSRYYDPAICRFINADALVSTGQSVLGFNMFAYCNNSPAGCADTSGSISYICLGDNHHLFTPMMLAGCGGGGGGYSFAIAGGGGAGKSMAKVKKFAKDVADFVTNTSEEATYEYLDSLGVALYKGVLILRADFGSGGGFSYGVIVLDNDYTFNDEGIKTLNHEYGHRVHMAQIGVINYTITTAVPSLVCAGFSVHKKLNISYYDLPWEYTADVLGGVSRDEYSPWARYAASVFWLHTMIVNISTGGV